MSTQIKIRGKYRKRNDNPLLEMVEEMEADGKKRDAVIKNQTIKFKKQTVYMLKRLTASSELKTENSCFNCAACLPFDDPLGRGLRCVKPGGYIYNERQAKDYLCNHWESGEVEDG